MPLRALAGCLLGGIIAGILQASPSVPWLSVIGIFVFARAVRELRPVPASAAGLLFGTAFIAIALDWTYLGSAAHRGPGDYLIAAIVVVYEALPYAVIGGFAAFTRNVTGPLWALGLACAWTEIELLRESGLWALPFANVGDTSVGTPFVVWATVFGGQGVSFLIVFLAALAASAQSRRNAVSAAASIFAMLVITSSLWLAWKTTSPTNKPLRIAVVQQGEPRTASLADYARGILAVAKDGPQLIVLPEAGFANDASDAGVTLAALRPLAKHAHAPIVVGVTLARPTGMFNAVADIGSGGAVAGFYRKQKLVPFGEFTPAAARLLMPASVLSDIPAYSAGDRPVVFHDAATPFAYAPLICFEGAFPELARDARRAGADVIVVALNDSWFGNMGGVVEHLDALRLRAVEEGTYVVIASTTGFSGVITPSGDLDAGDSARTARVLAAGPPRRTAFTQVGGGAILVFGWIGCVGVLLASAASKRKAVLARLQPSAEPSTT